MKSFIAITFVLAASQCPTDETADKKPPETDAAQVATDDAGGKTDAGKRIPSAAALQLKPGPAPFDVPTERVELDDFGATMLVPVGTRLEPARGALHAKLGEGKNFWVIVSPDATDLADLRNRIEGETTEVEAGEHHLIWNEGAAWFFHLSGVLSCESNPTGEYDRKDVEIMLAACGSIEQPGEELEPAEDEETK